MNCAVHTDTAATAYCRTCGKALCENCKRDVMGAIYCEPCIATRLHGTSAGFVAPGTAGTPTPGTLPGAPSPAIALLLGFIPGVGAMYNGQFTKAFIHVIIFVLLIVITSNYGPVGILIAFWVIYMAFEAYKTAEARQLGLPAPDPIGLDRIFGIQEKPTPTTAWTTTPPPAAGAAPVGPGGAPGPAFVAGAEPASAPGVPPHEATPTGAIVLIALGVLFLLSNFGIFSMHYFWPLLLIAIGLWIAYQRTAQRT
jgi:TM2 domain-containing membrane protein YozV